MSPALRLKILIDLILMAAIASSGRSGYAFGPAGYSLSSGRVANSSSDTGFAQFLPVIQHVVPPEIQEDKPIWAHASSPAKHEVSLFRKSFSLVEQLDQAELIIFADTRYEVWVDGNWVGRGPARFSLKTHEYDLYGLGSLPAGEHLIAVLVQWAPNNRRSESTTPYLQAHIQGRTFGGEVAVARTGPDWKALLSDAWQKDAAPVHNWELIGPTELLDLRRLPVDWMKAGFLDAGWQAAVEKDLTLQDYTPLVVPPFHLLPGAYPEEYEFTRLDPFEEAIDPADFWPRSIPALTQVSIPFTILDSGVLSPGRRIGEMLPGVTPNPYRFTASRATSFSIEILSASPPTPSGASSIKIDGSALQWQAIGPARPDVYKSIVSTIEAGEHSLDFPSIPADGLAFSITTQDLLLSGFPSQQGLHAGHRLLLAEPVSKPGAVSISTENGASLTFQEIPSYAVIDLGRTVHGRLVAEVAGPAGSWIDIGWDERLLPATLRPLPYPGSLHPEWNQVDSWILDGNTRPLSTIDARAGRYLLVAVWGSGPVEIRNIQVFEERYPSTQIGKFYSSNPILDKIWHLGVDTLYSNLTDAYADPWRERGQWWGDAYVTEHAGRVTFGDLELLRRGLHFMAEAFTNGRPNAMAPNGSGNHMLDYGMLWVQSLQEYYQLSGDSLMLKEAYPVLKDFFAYLSAHENPNTNLLDIQEGSWSETAYIDLIGAASRYGQSTALNAMYFGALLRGASVADAMGDATSAQIWNDKAKVVKDQINQLLYLPGEQRYVSSLLNGEIISPTPHAQAWALAYGIVPGDQVAGVAASLMESISFDPAKPEFEIYGTYWILEGLGRSGLIPEALKVVEEYYSHLLDSGARTTWETFNADHFFPQSLSHGWGSSPTWFLSTYVLGAKWAGPEAWVVAPALEGVERASGAIPLGTEALLVDWEQLECGQFSLNIDAPVSTAGELVLPNLGEAMEVELDSVVVWSHGEALVEGVTSDAQGIHIPTQGGLHALNIQAACSGPLAP